MSKVNEIRMQIIEVFEKYRIMDNPEDLTFEEMCHDDLTAILTELMEPIGEEEIDSEYELYLIDTLGKLPSEEAAFFRAAKWAATRNLKVSLEGLTRYKFEFYITHIDNNIKVEYPDGSYVKFEDAEKLVGGTQ